MSKKCEYVHCDFKLESPEELATGLCDRHLEAIRDPYGVVGTCWNCGTHVSIIRKSKSLLRIFGSEQPLYLFAKGCRNCENGKTDSENAWMTITANSPSTASVSPEGKLEGYSTHPRE